MQTKAIIALIAIVLVVIVAFLFFNKPASAPIQGNVVNINESMNMSQKPSIQPIEHASMVMEWGGVTLYVDPVGDVQLYANAPEPQIIFLTDIHGDHLSIETLEALVTNQTQLIVPQAVADKLPQALLEKSFVLENGDSTTQRGFSIEATPMYNVPESEEAYHTKGRGNGYILERDGMRVYIAGDTGPTSEMQALQDIDIAFVPMNLPYTMSVDDAAEAVLAFAPKQVYPYHYRGPDGLSDIARFKELVESQNQNIEVVLLEWYPEGG